MDKIKAIEIAMENELRERDFYLKQSEKTDNPVGKKMFAQIAKEEDEHYEMFKRIHTQLVDKGTWPEAVSAVVADTDLRDVLKSIPDLADKSAKSNADDVEAIKISIDFEKEAYKFYMELKEKAGNEDEKKFFAHLAQIEWDHAQSLEESLAFFEDPETWYEEREKSLLDG